MAVSAANTADSSAYNFHMAVLWFQWPIEIRGCRTAIALEVLRSPTIIFMPYPILHAIAIPI